MPQILSCAQCQNTFEEAPALVAGKFSYTDASGFCIKGIPLNVSQSCRRILRIIIEAGGDVVSDDALLEAVDSGSDNASNIVAVQLFRCRKAANKFGEAWPITRKRGAGHYWSGPKIEKVESIRPQTALYQKLMGDITSNNRAGELNRYNIVCPSCIESVEKRTTFIAGRFTYNHLTGFCISGRRLKARAAAHEMLGMIMMRQGLVISDKDLKTTIGSRSMKDSNVVAVQLSYAKRAIVAAGEIWPCDILRSAGRYWTGPDVRIS